MKNIFNFKKVIEKKEKVRDYEKGGYKTQKVSDEIYNIPKIIIFSIISLILLILIFGSFTIVKSGEVGLKVRLGKINDTKIDEGLHFKVPIIEKIKKVNIKVQKTEISTESSSKDLQSITTKLAVNYRIDIDKAVALYKEVGQTYEETILIPAIQESIKAVMSQYTAEQTITLRNKVSDNCLDEIQRKVKKYGINIAEFNIIDLDFSKSYSQAIEEKQVAEQKVLTAKQELEKTKIEAEKKIVEAEAINKANKLLKQNITNEVLKKQFIEKWDGKLPNTFIGQDILKIFNLK